MSALECNCGVSKGLRSDHEAECQVTYIQKDMEPDNRPPCACNCHEPDGQYVFCSCWGPCCHEPRKPKAEQTPRSPRRKVVIGDFMKFKYPIIRPQHKTESKASKRTQKRKKQRAKKRKG